MLQGGNGACTCTCPDCENSPEVSAAKANITQANDRLVNILQQRDQAETNILNINNQYADQIFTDIQTAQGHASNAASYVNQSIGLIDQGLNSTNSTITNVQNLLQQAIQLQLDQLAFLQSFTFNDNINNTVQGIVTQLQNFESTIHNITCMVEEEHYNNELFIKQVLLNEVGLRELIVQALQNSTNDFPSSLAQLVGLVNDEISTVSTNLGDLSTVEYARQSELQASANSSVALICDQWNSLNDLLQGFNNYSNSYRECERQSDIQKYQSLISSVEACAQNATLYQNTPNCNVTIPPYNAPIIVVPPPIAIPGPVLPPQIEVPTLNITIPNPVYECPPYERCPPCPPVTNVPGPVLPPVRAAVLKAGTCSCNV